jgi:mono/diheme cytochrome c family protein
MKRTLALTLAALAVGAVAAAVFLSQRHETVPAPSQPAAAGAPTGGGSEQMIRGEYLARIGDCYACHTVRGGQPYAGGLEIPTPFGSLYTPNITADAETGIGKWTADEFWRALHEGKGKDGSFLYPAFPYTNYTKVTRADSDAMYAYFQSVMAVRQANRPHDMRFPFNKRELLAGWRTLYFKPGEYKDDPAQSKEWNRGAYLVEGLGHCNACHSSRNILGAITKDEDYSGGLIPVQNWYAPSLTSSRETGIGSWEIGDIVDLLRTGVSPRSAVFGPMSAVVYYSLQELTLGDLTAMAIYLKSQSESRSPTRAPAEEMDGRAFRMMNHGASIYKKHCASCHQPKGQGVPRIYPPLASNEAISMRNPINAIRIVLNGGYPPSTEGNPRPYGMPPFSHVLSGDEIAAVVTYIRNSWGNAAPSVGPAEVDSARGVPVD